MWHLTILKKWVYRKVSVMDSKENIKSYFVIIEPKDENIAWFFLDSLGNKEYSTTINLTEWDKIPTKNDVLCLLQDVDFDFNFYIVEASSTSKTNVQVIDKGEVNREKDNSITEEIEK